MIEIKPKGSFHRLIPSRFPAVDFFEWSKSKEESLALAELEGLTNDRLLNEAGNIQLVAKSDWVGGPGSTPVMAAFTHPGISRLSTGEFGCYYAANNLETAIKETAFHRARFLSASKERPCSNHMREYVGTIARPMIDLSAKKYHHLLNPDTESYPVSQQFAATLRSQKKWGISYPSVRNPSGQCIAALRPPAINIPKQSRHFDYIWNGKEISCILKSSPIK